MILAALVLTSTTVYIPPACRGLPGNEPRWCAAVLREERRADTNADELARRQAALEACTTRLIARTPERMTLVATPLPEEDEGPPWWTWPVVGGVALAAGLVGGVLLTR